MHKIRGEARREAWKEDSNPWGKIPWQKRNVAADEEATRVPTNRTESFMPSSAETQRRTQYQQNAHTPHHANTLPSPVTGKQPDGNLPSTKDLPSASTNYTTEPEQVDQQGTSEDSGNGTSDTIVATPGISDNTTDQARPRRRRDKYLGAFSRKKAEDPGQPGKPKRPGLEGKRIHSSQFFKKDTQKFTVGSQLRATLFNSWINLLLVFVPVGIALHYAGIKPVIIFVVNFIAIIPLAAMLSYATEEIALRVGETLGGLLNATFGNAVELIVSILALVKNQIDIVQESLIGSILSNLLLVMGMSFFLGGITRIRQHFNLTVAQTASSLLALAVGSLIIPAAFRAWAEGESDADKEADITALSRGTSILLLVVYGCYLLFQLKTHISIYNAPSKKVEKRSQIKAREEIKEGKALENLARSTATYGATARGSVALAGPGGPEDSEKVGDAVSEPEEEEEEREQPQLSKWVAILTLAISTALVALCAEGMVSSIDAITESGGISRTFVGLILLPIVGNAAEHATAVTVAIKDKMDLSIGVAVGSSMQVALLVIPFMVVLGWILGKDDMNLAFDGFQIIVLFVSILLVNYLIQDGESHWLEGVLLCILYLIIAVAAWYYPKKEAPSAARMRI